MRSNRSKRVSALRWASCICLLFLIWSLCACGARASEEKESAVLSATISRSGEQVKVSVYLDEGDLAKYEKSTIALFGLESFQTTMDVEAGRLKPIDTKGSAKKLSFSVDYVFDHGTRTRLTQRFLVAVEHREATTESGDPTYTVLTEAVYLSNPETLAVREESENDSATLKGLAVDARFDSSVLSPSQVVVDLYLEDYIADAAKKGETLSSIYMGESVYFYRSAVEQLDEQMRYLAAGDTAVYFRFLIRTPGVAGAMVYPSSPKGEYYLPNLQSEDGALRICGFLDFFAARYASDERYSSVL